jgi:hypothetical protein
MRRHAALAMLLGTRLAWAEVCAQPGRPWIEVVDAPNAVSDDVGRRIVEQLRAGLARRKIAVCEPSRRPRHAPIAQIVFARVGGSHVRIDVTVSDAVTDKRVSRSVDLAPLPRDAWPLSLALATDEVLQASWAELALRSAPAPKRPVPHEVRQSVLASIAPAQTGEAPRDIAIGAALVLDAYTAGQVQVGVDARMALWLGRAMFASATAGMRSGRVVAAEHGQIHTRAASFSLGPGFSLTDRRAALGIEVMQRTQVSLARFEGEPDAGGRGRTASATAVYATAVVAGWLAPDPALRLDLELGAGAPVRAARASDSGDVVTGMDGARLSLALAFGGVF